MYPFDNPIEIVWTVITSLGTLSQFDVLREAWKDYRAAVPRNGRPEDIALMSLRNESMFFIIQLLFLLIGLLAVADPTPPANVSPIRTLTAGTFIIFAIVLALNSRINGIVRRNLLK